MFDDILLGFNIKTKYKRCIKKFKMPECENRKCLELITVEDVFRGSGKIIKLDND